jgi:hypothetical protein
MQLQQKVPPVQQYVVDLFTPAKPLTPGVQQYHPAQLIVLTVPRKSRAGKPIRGSMTITYVRLQVTSPLNLSILGDKTL